MWPDMIYSPSYVCLVRSLQGSLCPLKLLSEGLGQASHTQS